MKKILTFIIFSLFLLPSVKAEQATLNKDYINDVYIYYYDGNLGRNRYVEAEKFTFGNSTAYCLEIGTGVVTNFYTYSPSFEELHLGSGVIDYIKLVAYYGYDYPGHHTDKYYLATQEMIWEKISGKEISWVKNLNPSDCVDVTNEKNEIEALMSTHYVKPSFSDTEIEVIKGKELIIEDTNGVLSRYTTSSPNATIDGNKLIISKDFDEEEIIFTKKIYDSKEFFLYTAGVSQKMLSVGELNDITSSLKTNVAKGSLEIHKLDMETGSDTPQGDASLLGAIYELYDEEDHVVATFIIGKREKVDNIPYGSYILKEKEASTGYYLDPSTYPITIGQDNTEVTLTVYEQVIKRQVDLFKVYASDKTGILVGEANIEFEIYNSKGESIATIVTDETGYATATLPYGIYTFKQKNSPDNYYKVEDFTVEITEDNARPICKIISNSELKAKVKVIKKDADTKENITDSKIKFKIYDVTNDKFVSFKVSYPTPQVVEEFTIDEHGVFITPDFLSPGDYILMEVDDDMDNYLYNDKTVNFTIGFSSNFVSEDGELILEIPFYNQRVKGKLNLTKVGEQLRTIDDKYYYEKIFLEKTSFGLYADEDIYESKTLIYSKDELITHLVTDEYGKASVDSLPLGKYYLVEEETAKGHILADKIYNFSLSYIDEYTKTVEYNLTVENYLAKGKLIINKLETGTNNPLDHTLIEIHTTNNDIIWKGYTDANGQIIIDDLPYGEYYLSEREAHTGYRLLEDNIYFEIGEEEVSINIYNERIEVPSTGLISANLPIIIPTLVIILSIITIIILNKNTKAVIFCTVISLLSITLIVSLLYKTYVDNTSRIKSVEAFVSKQVVDVKDEKYDYKSVLQIPSIGLKGGITSIDNKYNDAKYNIELVEEKDNLIVLASHNGNYQNSYFGKLKNMELGDEIKYYKDGKLYTYIYSNSYEIKKDGYADIYRKNNESAIVLITCKDNSDDAQIVHIGYLKDVSSY